MDIYLQAIWVSRSIRFAALGFLIGHGVRMNGLIQYYIYNTMQSGQR